MDFPRSTVFLSHASEDKDLVAEVYSRLDNALTFYDVKTMAPGEECIRAMEDGVGRSAVFVLFHTPNSHKVWVEYEKKLAELSSVTSKSFKVIVCPFGGESYKSLPKWLSGFMTIPDEYTTSDIVRTIQYHYRGTLEALGYKPNELIGREPLLRKIALDVQKAIAKTGKPLQQIVVTGLPGIGRKSIAYEICKHALPNMKPAGPHFELPDMAEAVDLFIKLREDLVGAMSAEEFEKQIDAFQDEDVDSQAEILLNNLLHWANLNQPIILETRWGLRDRTRKLKGWFEKLLNLWINHPNLRVVFVSERRLDEEEVSKFSTLVQYNVERLSDDDIQYMLSADIEGRLFDIGQAEDISKKILGHPATAKHVASLVNNGRNFDTLNSNPKVIHRFQDKILDAFFDGDLLTERQREIVCLLGWFPRLPTKFIAKILGDLDRDAIAEDLWYLADLSLVSSSQGGYYHIPDIVSARIKRDPSLKNQDMFVRVKAEIEAKINEGGLQSELIDTLLISSVETEGDLPKEVMGLLTSSSLLKLVQELFLAARNVSGSQHEAFDRIYNLSKIAFQLQTSDDAVEQILFTGGDSAIRSGKYPDDIIDFMEKKGMASVYYLKGSYAFYVQRDYSTAARNLQKSFDLKHFRMRNARLLTKSYIRDKRFDKALDVLDQLHPERLAAETGMQVSKVRALRGMRRHAEADELERQLKPTSDDYGEVYLLRAGRALQLGDIPTARKCVEDGRNAPRINKLSLQLMDCAVAIEEGNYSLLAETVSMANGAGRVFDAYQLQAKASLKDGDCDSALELINKIETKDYFDLQVELEILRRKIVDPDVLRDPVLKKTLDRRIEEISVLSLHSPQGYRDA